MSKTENKIMIPEEIILSKIYLIRDKKVMLDRDLAEFYGIETRRLKEQVRRNIERFPEDFMIEFTKEELENFRQQFGSTSKEIMGLRIAPFAFTEHGILMLASVLNTERAIQINIHLVRVFNKMREVLLTHKELFLEMDKIKSKFIDYDNKFILIFEYLKQFEESKQQQLDHANRKRIGFKKHE
ncbi:MAG TPA: ORF6N domain-containing protein [Bacteroidales bacterium]|nr:ORF6N domain-containing protein [Bacteroidales bacterium]HNW97525.1 ORF6N domain-containing protein [Bacteroidales bacterium]HPS16567.1 ORF6N domain-containing protein [Bacteroidales bacterium]HPS16575.1 ORF6N domain-containing protein [Bacteroidales bacterium]